MHRIGVNWKGCAVAYCEESPALGYQKKRLAIKTYGKVRYLLKTPYHDGTTVDRLSLALSCLSGFVTGGYAVYNNVAG